MSQRWFPFQSGPNNLNLGIILAPLLIIIFAPVQNMGGLMTLLADKMVKTKKVFGANIQEILKVIFIAKAYNWYKEYINMW